MKPFSPSPPGEDVIVLYVAVAFIVGVPIFLFILQLLR